MASAQGRERIHVFFHVKQPGEPDRILVWDTQDISVGRSADNDLSIDVAELSRKHAAFAKQSDAFVVKDLNTSNGTLVNGQKVQVQPLKNKDKVQIAELELTFYRVPKNPASLGLKVEYASQLKQFGPMAGQAADGEATILGLVDTVGGDDDFEVGPANEFEYDLHGMQNKSAPRDLDAELDDPGLAELDMPTPGARAPARPAPQPRGAAKPGIVSFSVKIDGLSPELANRLRMLFGKVIALPQMRIRLDGDDLG